MESHRESSECGDANQKWTSEDEKRWRLELLSSGSYKAKLGINHRFYGLLIGERGSSQRALENSLDVQMRFPRRKDKTTNVVEVYGRDKDILMSACRRILIRVEELRPRIGMTHFVSIPLNTPAVRQAFETFRDRALALEESLDPRGFTKSVRLHLTLVVMGLFEEEEETRAVDLLKTCKKKIIQAILGEKKPLQVELKGLQIMNNDPKRAKILFIDIKSEFLQRICDELVEAFVKEGITPQSKAGKVKMHMTLINTKRIKHPTKRWNDVTVNVEKILREFQNLSFGVVEASELHLNEMNEKNEEGYYKSLGKIDLLSDD